MRTRLAGGLLAACATLALASLAYPAHAQTILQQERRPIPSQASRPLFRGRTAANTLLFQRAPAPAAPSWALQVGAFYDDLGDGSSLTGIPAEVRLELPGGATKFLLDVDIYDWLDSGSETTKGTGDPSLTALQGFQFDKSNSLALGAGVTVPCGSALRAQHATQSLVAIYGHSFADDTFAQRNWLKQGSAELWLIADHQKQPDGSNAATTTWTGKAYYYQALPRDADIFGVIVYSYQRDGRHGTSIGIGTDFVLSDRPIGPFKAVKASLSGSCKLTGANNCGTVAFDLQLPL